MSPDETFVVKGANTGAEEMTGNYRRNIYITYHELEMALRRRGYSLYKLLIGTLIAAAATTALFWNDIKHWGAQESASVATRTLEDEMLQKKAEDMAKQLTNALLTDERTMRAVQTLLKQVMSDPKSRQDATIFVSEQLAVLMERKHNRKSRKEPAFLSSIRSLRIFFFCAGFAVSLPLCTQTQTHAHAHCTGEDVKIFVANFLADVLQYDAVRNGAKDLGVWVVGHPYIIEKVKESLLQLLEDQSSKDAGKEYGKIKTTSTMIICGRNGERISLSILLIQEYVVSFCTFSNGRNVENITGFCNEGMASAGRRRRVYRSSIPREGWRSVVVRACNLWEDRFFGSCFCVRIISNRCRSGRYRFRTCVARNDR